MKSHKLWTCWTTVTVITLLVVAVISLEGFLYFSSESNKSSSKSSSSGNSTSRISSIKNDESSHPNDNSRQKRFLFFTSDRRLSLPPDTTLIFSTFLTMPAVRNLPSAYAADMTLESQFIIAMQALGYTSEENPWFLIPYYKFKDDSDDLYPGINLAGGDRLIMYQAVEDMMTSIGLFGKPCLLRAICEVFEAPFDNHGFLGEILKLFFSVSRSHYARERLGDYLDAERSGKDSGDCSLYYDACVHSLFTNSTVQQKPKLIQVSEDSSRQKRFVYLTPERRLTLPPSSVLLLVPIIQFPIRGSIPNGISGPSVQISSSFTISFDDLGLTSEENQFGVFPFLDEFLDEEPRRKRATFNKKTSSKYPGGDRDMLYQVVEDTLSNIGLNGKACLLRTICEMFQYPLDNHGFFGEFLELFFSVGLSPDAERRLPEYVAAERAGRTSGNCGAYHHKCPFSLFTNPMDDITTENATSKQNRGSERPSNKNSLFSTSNMLAILFEYLESWL